MSRNSVPPASMAAEADHLGNSDFFDLHPLLAAWFQTKFGSPTPPQREGWPAIASGMHTLIAAPTGSGKTLAAFMISIDRLVKQWQVGQLRDSIDTIYVSPLRALSNDIERNLQQPLTELTKLASEWGLGELPIRTALRTGDTTSAQRQAIIRKPPHILVTTPESLYLLLTSARGRERMTDVRTVIVDEIHALARDKRGSHLSLTLERLAHVANQPLVRIGLSATQKPIEEIGAFLVGARPRGDAGDASVAADQSTTGKSAIEEAYSGAMPPIDPFIEDDPESDPGPACDSEPNEATAIAQLPARAERFRLVDAGHLRELDLGIEVPPSELAAVCTHEQWGEVYERLLELIKGHRSTLIFVNTRRLAERVAHGLRELLGEDAVASHHGSLAKELRLSAEQRLKNGELKAIVATASLELGIDIGLIDLVCQIGSPRSIATFLQRIGRSGHSLGATPCGRLFPLTRDELLESIALIRAIRNRRLDAIEIPHSPLDILAQQIIAEVSQEEWSERALFDRFRCAWPYRDLSYPEYSRIVAMVSEGVNRSSGKGAYVHRDQINGLLRGRRGARLAAITSGGAIPETAEYRVVTDPEGVVVGSVDEDFAIESTVGSVFLLGNTSWRILGLRGGDMLVADAEGMPPNIPFWFGEAPGRTVELSAEVSQIRQEIIGRIHAADPIPLTESNESQWRADQQDLELDTELARKCMSPGVIDWIAAEGALAAEGARQASLYVATQFAAMGIVPTGRQIVFERFFDESGGTQIVIHAPLGGRINRAWGLSLRKRFCRSFDFELQAAADDNGVVLSLGPQHSLPLENLFTMLRADNARYLLEQAMLAVPFFQVRWRWNVTRALAVLRRRNGKKVPPHLQRFRSDDLLASAFPETVGCLENHHGDVEIPDHPLVQQTMRDCLFEASDADRFIEMLSDVEQQRIELIARETTEPSPFSHELINANPYAFLDDAPLEERRSRAVSTRRTLSTDQMHDLGRLDPGAVNEIRKQAWPVVRDADELHDALMSMQLLADVQAGHWSHFLQQLADEGRATQITVEDQVHDQETEAEKTPYRFWVAAERLGLAQVAFGRFESHPPLPIRDEFGLPDSRTAARVELIRGAISHAGPISVGELSESLNLAAHHAQSALEALEAEGVVMRGHYTDELAGRGTLTTETGPPVQWCERRLLARIHQMTLQGLRKQIRPVSPDVFMRFLLERHQLIGERLLAGPDGLRAMITRLQGIDISAAAWEAEVLGPRFDEYDPRWLDELFNTGELTWGRMVVPRKKGEPIPCSFQRNVPLSLMIRTDLSWLFPEGATRLEHDAESAAGAILGELRSCGAVFAQDLSLACGLTALQVEETLRDLVSQGLVSCDSFAPVRGAISKRKTDSARTASRRHSQQVGREIPGSRWTARRSLGGRWSPFPPRMQVPSAEERVESWCHLLLHRYGVVFRELAAREAAAPRWFELQSMFRRLEMRGEIRGGRFVEGVGGEQFAMPDTITELREVRDRQPDEQSVVISAADPLNLIGIIDSHPRLAPSARNAILIRDGKALAVRDGVDIEFLVEESTQQQSEDRQQLLQFGLPKRSQEIRNRRKRLA